MCDNFKNDKTLQNNLLPEERQHKCVQGQQDNNNYYYNTIFTRVRDISEENLLPKGSKYSALM